MTYYPGMTPIEEAEYLREKLAEKATSYFAPWAANRYWTLLAHWVPTKNYNKNDCVQYNGKAYCRIAATATENHDAPDIATSIWYSIVETEGHTTAPAWEASTTYSRGEKVKNGSLYYVSLIDNNTGNQPTASSSVWAFIPATVSKPVRAFDGITIVDPD